MKWTCKPNVDAGLLAIRLTLASTFILSGLLKLMSGAQASGFFMKIGFPGFMAYVVAVGELLSGLAMFAGVFTRLAGAFIMVIMAVAILKLQWSKGFLGYGWEFSLFMSALAITLGGTGKYTVLFKKNKA